MFRVLHLFSFSCCRESCGAKGRIFDGYWSREEKCAIKLGGLIGKREEKLGVHMVRKTGCYVLRVVLAVVILSNS